MILIRIILNIFLILIIIFSIRESIILKRETKKTWKEVDRLNKELKELKKLYYDKSI